MFVRFHRYSIVFLATGLGGGGFIACSAFEPDDAVAPEEAGADGGVRDDGGIDAARPRRPERIADQQTGVFDVIAVDGIVYWSTSETIFKADADGTIGVAAAAQREAQGLAAGNGHLYWANWFDANRSIMKLPLDGGVASPVVKGAPSPSRIALSGEQPFWNVVSLSLPQLPNAVRGAGPDGGAERTYASDTTGITFSGPAVAAGHVFWVERSEPARIMRAPIGGDAKPFATEQIAALELTADETDVYWTRTNPTGAVMRAPLEGGDPRMLVSGLGDLGKITQRGSTLFVHDRTTRRVLAIDKATGDVTTIAEDQVNGGGIFADDVFVYWTADGDGAGQGSVWKAPR